MKIIKFARTFRRVQQFPQVPQSMCQLTGEERDIRIVPSRVGSGVNSGSRVVGWGRIDSPIKSPQTLGLPMVSLSVRSRGLPSDSKTRGAKTDGTGHHTGIFLMEVWSVLKTKSTRKTVGRCDGARKRASLGHHK